MHNFDWHILIILYIEKSPRINPFLFHCYFIIIIIIIVLLFNNKFVLK